MMNKLLVLLVFVIGLQLNSHAQVRPVRYNTEYKVIFSANYGAHYNSLTKSDVVSGILRVITPGNIILGIMWDNIQPKPGHCYGIQGGYSVQKSDQFYIDLMARVFNNKPLGIGFGFRPELRYDFTDWFSMQVGPDINYNKTSLRIGAVGGFSIGFIMN